MDDALPIFSTALPSVEVQQPEKSVRVCIITLAGELFAIDLRNVGEVFEVESITPVPGMPSAMTGVTNLRGVIVPMMDLRPMLGLGTEEPASQVAVVIRHQGQQIGILVDHIPEIRTVPMSEFQTSPAGGTRARSPFVSSILRVDNRISGVVEVPALLACVDS